MAGVQSIERIPYLSPSEQQSKRTFEVNYSSSSNRHVHWSSSQQGSLGPLVVSRVLSCRVYRSPLSQVQGRKLTDRSDLSDPTLESWRLSYFSVVSVSSQASSSRKKEQVLSLSISIRRPSTRLQR